MSDAGPCRGARQFGRFEHAARHARCAGFPMSRHRSSRAAPEGTALRHPPRRTSVAIGCSAARVAARRLDQKLVERLQKLGAENLDDRRFRPGASLLIGELHRMAEQRRQRRDIDAGRRETVLKRRIGHDAGRARHRLDALQRDQRRIAGSRCRYVRGPAAHWRCASHRCSLPIRFSAGTTTSSKKHLGELVVARDRLDRPDLDSRAVQIDQQEADAGVPRLRLRIGAHQREHPVRMMRPGGPDLVALDHEMVAFQRRAGRKAPPRPRPTGGSSARPGWRR